MTPIRLLNANEYFGNVDDLLQLEIVEESASWYEFLVEDDNDEIIDLSIYSVETQSRSGRIGLEPAGRNAYSITDLAMDAVAPAFPVDLDTEAKKLMVGQFGVYFPTYNPTQDPITMVENVPFIFGSVKLTEKSTSTPQIIVMRYLLIYSYSKPA